LLSLSNGAARAFGDPTHGLAGTLTGLTDGLAGLTGNLTQALDRLADIADRLTGAFADVANGLAGALADLTDGLARAFAQLTDGLAGALANISDSLARPFADLTDSLIGTFTDLADGLAGSRPHVLNGSARAFTDVLNRLAGRAESLPGTPTDVFDRPPQALYELWIAVDGGEDAVDDRRDAVEPDFQQSLRLDAFDVDSELAEVSVDPRVEFDQVQDLRLQRNPGVEVVELEVDRVDLDHGNVQENIGVAAWVLYVRERIRLVLALGGGPRLGDVLREAVLAGFFRGSPAFALAALGGFDVFVRPPRRCRGSRRLGLLRSHHSPPSWP
jgi:hypothetical protein